MQLENEESMEKVQEWLVSVQDDFLLIDEESFLAQFYELENQKFCVYISSEALFSLHTLKRDAFIDLLISLQEEGILRESGYYFIFPKALFQERFDFAF